MGFAFEYDPRKAATNLRKHGVSFAEAMTVFDDPLSSTLSDDPHSEDEVRFITVGRSSRQRILFFVYAESISGTGSLVPVPQLRLRFTNMKKAPELDPLRERPDLDFSKGVRGKYYDRMREGTNIVLLAPDLMEAFPNSDAVNDALRKYQALTAKRA